MNSLKIIVPSNVQEYAKTKASQGKSQFKRLSIEYVEEDFCLYKKYYLNEKPRKFAFSFCRKSETKTLNPVATELFTDLKIKNKRFYPQNKNPDQHSYNLSLNVRQPLKQNRLTALESPKDLPNTEESQGAVNPLRIQPGEQILLNSMNQTQNNQQSINRLTQKPHEKEPTLLNLSKVSTGLNDARAANPTTETIVFLEENPTILKLKNQVQQIVKKIAKYKICKNITEIESLGYKPIIINLAYWPEIDHPQHLYLDSSRKIYDYWSKTKGKDSYNEYCIKLKPKGYVMQFLRQKDYLKYLLHNHLPLVRMLKSDQKAQYLTTITQASTGYKLASPQRRYTDSTDPPIFVLTPDFNLYTSVKIKGQLHHSSFTKYQSVISAGMIALDRNLDISEIINQSGHYPSSLEGLEQVLRSFSALFNLDPYHGDILSRQSDPVSPPVYVWRFCPLKFNHL